MKITKKTMWLYSKRKQVADKNRDKLIETSNRDKVPVARLDCSYDTNKTQSGKERHAICSHFDQNSFIHHRMLLKYTIMRLYKYKVS